MTEIGTLNEQHLHAELKSLYRERGDLVEVPIGGFVIDLVRDDTLIEIQTRSFSSMRKKLDVLLDAHPILLIHPIAAERWIRRIDDSGQEVSRRRSPKRGKSVDVCAELVSFPSLLSHPNFTLEILLVQEEEVRRPDPKAWRRGGWCIAERRLLGILERARFSAAEDLLSLLPEGLPDPFTTDDLATALTRSRHLAQEVAYCLREAGVLEAVGRNKDGVLYRRP